MLFRSRRKKQFMMISEKKEEKRWSEGWAVLMADGYGEKRVAWEEKRKRKKKKKKKDGLKDERAVGNQ